MNHKKPLALSAGIQYLFIAILGSFAHVVIQKIYLAGDAAQTAHNVLSNGSLMR